MIVRVVTDNPKANARIAELRDEIAKLCKEEGFDTAERFGEDCFEAVMIVDDTDLKDEFKLDVPVVDPIQPSLFDVPLTGESLP